MVYSLFNGFKQKPVGKLGNTCLFILCIKGAVSDLFVFLKPKDLGVIFCQINLLEGVIKISVSRKNFQVSGTQAPVNRTKKQQPIRARCVYLTVSHIV